MGFFLNFIIIFKIFIYLFLSVLGLRCCSGFSLVVVSGLLVAVASLVEHSLQGIRASVVGARGISGPVACGIFPDQGSNLCPLHWQVDSLLLHHQGSQVLCVSRGG